MSAEEKHLQSFKIGDTIILRGQPDRKMTIKAWHGHSSAFVNYFDERGVLHDDSYSVPLQGCEHAE